MADQLAELGRKVQLIGDLGSHTAEPMTGKAIPIERKTESPAMVRREETLGPRSVAWMALTEYFLGLDRPCEHLPRQFYWQYG